MLIQQNILRAIVNRILIFMFLPLIISCDQKNDEQEESVNHDKEWLHVNQDYQEEEEWEYYNNEWLYVGQDYHENGNLKIRQTYKQIDTDSFIGHGYNFTYYPTGEVKAFGNLHRGNVIGNVLKYFKNGDIQEVLFYDPQGYSLSVIKYDSLGNVIEEKGRDRRKPQVIIKDLNVDSVKLTVYSMHIPTYEKNIYLKSSGQGTIDSIISSEDPFDVFQSKIDTSMFEVLVQYIDPESGAIISNDYSKFRLYN